VFFEKLKWERYYKYAVYLFRHLNPFFPEKMQSDRKFRRHVIDPH